MGAVMDRRTFLASAGPALIATPAAAICEAPVRLSPQGRIELSVSEIRAAMAELYPGSFISAKANLRDGSGAIALGAYPVNGFGIRYFFCDDPESWSPAESTRDE